jgi:ARG and Rhodanese-Phosphatase-superfamily-associated Protein domain
MERSVLALLGSSFFGVATFAMATLGLLWSAPGGSPPPGKGEGEWRLLEPISYENLTVFPVMSSYERDTSAFLTLEEGLSRGEVIVQEQGADTMVRDREGRRPVVQNFGGPSVNQLVLVNRSKQPLLLLAGELVSGGKQDRVIAKDRIVPPLGEPLPLDVFCVEHGRWSAGSKFTSAASIVHPSVREQAAMKQEQRDVWASVTAGSTAPQASAPGAPAPRVSADALSQAVEAEAPTQSYSKLYGSRRVTPSVDAMVNEVQRRFHKEAAGLKGERVVGVVIAYGGEVAWSDIFASGELFDQYWSKLLRSYAVEAVARPTLRERASLEDAQEFLQHLTGREKTESEPGVYQWREINEGNISQIELEALRPKTMMLHRLVVRRTS